MLERWHADFGTEHDSEFDRLAAAYSEPHRAYHTLSHVRAVLEAVDAALPWAADHVALRVAAWIHDAVYDPAAKDNEERSAALVPELFGFVPGMANEKAARLVRATATHVPQGEDPDELIFLDADLLILAASPADLTAYERGIRLEYSFVDDAAYRRGRGAVLRSFLERDRIYRHPIHQHHERAARANIKKLIEDLRRPR